MFSLRYFRFFSLACPDRRLRSPYTLLNDRFFLPISPYFSVYDTEIYDRNTITCKSSYLSVYGRLRPCVFDYHKHKYKRKLSEVSISFYTDETFYTRGFKKIGERSNIMRQGELHILHIFSLLSNTR